MKRKESYQWTEEDDELELDVDRGFIVVSEGIAWGPFLLPEYALRFAMKIQPDHLFRLHVLMNPAIVE